MTLTDLVPVSPPTSAVHVVIVDRHPLFARGLQAALDEVAVGRVAVAAAADDASGVTDLLRRHRPEVLIVDLELPAPGGLAAIAAARRGYPGVRIAAMAPDTVSADAAAAALAAGADGVLLRGAAPDSVAVQLLAIAAGASLAPPRVVTTMLRRRPASELVRQLRPADVELWRLIAEGHETIAIAARLCVSERTAKRLVARLLQRIGVTSRLQAAALAGRCGLLDEPWEAAR